MSSYVMRLKTRIPWGCNRSATCNLEISEPLKGFDKRHLAPVLQYKR